MLWKFIVFFLLLFKVEAFGKRSFGSFESHFHCFVISFLFFIFVLSHFFYNYAGKWSKNFIRKIETCILIDFEITKKSISQNLTRRKINLIKFFKFHVKSQNQTHLIPLLHRLKSSKIKLFPQKKNQINFQKKKENSSLSNLFFFFYVPMNFIQSVYFILSWKWLFHN